jgi:hypothetical protein
LHLNFQGISTSNKLNLLHQFIENRDFGFILLNEHWINKSEIDILKLNGYNQMSYFARAKNLRGGALIKSNLSLKGWALNQGKCILKFAGYV